MDANIFLYLQWVPKEYTPYSPSKDSRLRSPGAPGPSLSPNRSPLTRETRQLRVSSSVREKVCDLIFSAFFFLDVSLLRRSCSCNTVDCNIMLIYKLIVV